MTQRRGIFRRIAASTATLTLLLSVATWALSMFRPKLAMPYPRWTTIVLLEGGVEIHRTMLPGESRWIGYVGPYHSWWPRARLRTATVVEDMSRLTTRKAVTGRVFVPLWIPIAGSCMALVFVRFMSRDALPSQCPSCAYDLTGINGACPECGTHRPPNSEPPAVS